jgi:hypothetical protein
MTLSGANSIVEPSPMLGENTKKSVKTPMCGSGT